MSFTQCAGCGKSIFDWPIALHRISPDGTEFVGKCNECLGRGENTTNQNDALFDAIESDAARQESNDV